MVRNHYVVVSNEESLFLLYQYHYVLVENCDVGQKGTWGVLVESNFLWLSSISKVRILLRYYMQ